MNKKLLKLESKYGETVLRLALYQLLQVGIRTAAKLDDGAETARALIKTDENSIVTPEVQAQIIGCVRDLAKLKPDDIFGYVKTELPIHGITVHEGKNICVRWDGTNDLILYCTVPGDTDLEKIDEVDKKLDEIVEAYSVEDDKSGNGFDFDDAIWKAFLSVGLRPKRTAVDRTIYV